MNLANATLLASVSKHDEAGIAALVIALVLLFVGGLRLAVKAVAIAMFLLAVAVAVVAVLLFTRVL